MISIPKDIDKKKKRGMIRNINEQTTYKRNPILKRCHGLHELSPESPNRTKPESLLDKVLPDTDWLGRFRQYQRLAAASLLLEL